MKFSIIIPVKEINNYIRESVPYLLKQKYSNFEIIILPNDQKKTPDWLKSDKVKMFLRSERWVVVGHDQIRTKNENFTGPDRRENFN